MTDDNPPSPGGAGEARHAAALRRLDRVARLMDTALRVPGTSIRFGADALVGLVPGIGDLAGTAVSAWLVWEAWRLGASGGVIARMLVNVGIDALVGAVPVAGDLFDVAWRANHRNMRLLREHLARRGALDTDPERRTIG